MVVHMCMSHGNSTNSNIRKRVVERGNFKKIAHRSELTNTGICHCDCGVCKTESCIVKQKKKKRQDAFETRI